MTELSRWTGLPKSTTHRLLGLLCDAGFVCRAKNVYYLRSSVMELGALALGGDARTLRETALPFMSDLGDATSQTVHLAVLDGYDVIYLEKLHGHTSVVVPSRVGSRLPAHASALGKVLLAHSPQGYMDAFLKRPMRRMTPRTVSAPGQLAAALGGTRRDGLAHDYEEVREGVSCVAAPIRGVKGSVIAAVSVCGWTRDLRDGRLDMVTRRAAHAISNALVARGLDDPVWNHAKQQSSSHARFSVGNAG
jgi:DNA-binding IclR family transcriptional regulator